MRFLCFLFLRFVSGPNMFSTLRWGFRYSRDIGVFLSILKWCECVYVFPKNVFFLWSFICSRPKNNSRRVAVLCFFFFLMMWMLCFVVANDVVFVECVFFSLFTSFFNRQSRLWRRKASRWCWSTPTSPRCRRPKTWAELLRTGRTFYPSRPRYLYDLYGFNAVYPNG